VLSRALVCLAFATWCFLNTWVEYAEGRIAYFARNDPFHAVIIPVLCCELLIAGCMAIAWEVCRRLNRTNWLPLHILFLLGCCAPAGIATVAVVPLLPFDVVPLIRKPLFWPIVLAVTTPAAAFAILRLRRTALAARSILLYSWPILVMVMIQAGRVTLFRYPASAYRDGILASRIDSPPAPVRVVWIIFDELSQTISFTHRPAGLTLPNFDRLRRESLFATAANSPADATERSMPSLILGQKVLEVTPNGPDDLELSMATSSGPVSWKSLPNVFDQTRQLGLNTALIGWAHPYGRLLNRSLTSCYWTPGWLLSGAEESFEDLSLPEAMWFRIKLQLSAMPLVGHLPGVFPGFYQRADKIRRFDYLMEGAHEVVADPSISLVLIHLQAPHPPAIYSRSAMAETPNGRIGYIDNVALADHALGEVRDSLAVSGLDDRTALIVSADHGWRTRLWRGTPEWTEEEERASHEDTSGVPFLVHLPRQKDTLVYDPEFDTVVTSRLILDILRGDVRRVNDVVAIIGRSATR